MSDVVRNYTGSGGRVRSRPLEARGGCLRRAGLAIAIAAAVFVWLTWNSYDAGEFVPAGLRYNVVLTDPVNGIERIASSRVWNAWPDTASRDALLQQLRQDPGLPRWVLNNLLTRRLYLAGNDMRKFSDALAIAQMSRIGALLERAMTLGPDVSRDYAGGLRLRHIASSGLYYAVRGRVAIVSRDRNVLVRALTLRAEDTLAGAALENLLSEGAEDVRGTIELAPDDPLGDAFQSVAFAVRVDDDRAYAKCHATIREPARARFGPLLNGAKPGALANPIPGAIELSANFGKPVREVWASLGEALQTPWMSAGQWQAWETTPAGGPPGIAQAITAMVGPLGPAIRLSCTGIDANEMFPVPVIVGTLETPAGTPPDLASLPPPPPGTNVWDSYPRYNADKKLVSVPLVGGPSLEPAAALSGGDLLIGTSRSAVETLTRQTPPADALPEQANLFVRAHPDAIVREGAATLRQFAEMGMLRGYTLESFDAAAQGWAESAARVREIVVVASGTDEAIDAELRIECNGPVAQEGKKTPP